MILPERRPPGTTPLARGDRPPRGPGAVALAAQRAALRSNRGALQWLWRLTYGLLARAATSYLRLARRGTAAYLRGSLATRDPVYGPADIDLTMVVPAQPGRPGVARARTHARWQALVSRLPLLESLVQVTVYEPDELARATSMNALTEDLPPEGRLDQPADGPSGADRPQRLFADEAKLRIRPGLGIPTAGWRRIAGPELRPSPPAATPERHLAAWLELQWWWRLCFEACLHPRRLHVPYLCLKLITQSARVRLWIEGNELVSGHAQVLSRSLTMMPEEEDALRAAARLWKELPRSPDPPLADATAFLLRTSARVAELLASEARASEGRPVRLLGADAQQAELALTPAARSSLTELEKRFGNGHLLPLADWRARTPQPLWRAGRLDPLLADEALAVVAADPADPTGLAALAKAGGPGLRPAIGWKGLMVLPSAGYFELLFRGVQFECSDPVSFALLAGQSTATFPAHRGWSAPDCAHRAVAAHAVWLQRFETPAGAEAGTALGLLLGAARAALFRQSVEEGEPELALTVSAAADRLAAEYPGSATLLEEASGAYRAWRGGGEPPERKAVIAVRRLIESLPAYDSPLHEPTHPAATMAGEVVAR
jgi:hypothetical protein